MARTAAARLVQVDSVAVDRSASRQPAVMAATFEHEFGTCIADASPKFWHPMNIVSQNE